MHASGERSCATSSSSSSRTASRFPLDAPHERVMGTGAPPPRGSLGPAPARVGHLRRALAGPPPLGGAPVPLTLALSTWSTAGGARASLPPPRAPPPRAARRARCPP